MSLSEDSTDSGEMRLAATILNECETEGQREEYIKAVLLNLGVNYPFEGNLRL